MTDKLTIQWGDIIGLEVAKKTPTSMYNIQSSQILHQQHFSDIFERGTPDPKLFCMPATGGPIQNSSESGSSGSGVSQLMD